MFCLDSHVLLEDGREEVTLGGKGRRCFGFGGLLYFWFQVSKLFGWIQRRALRAGSRACTSPGSWRVIVFNHLVTLHMRMYEKCFLVQIFVVVSRFLCCFYESLPIKAETPQKRPFFKYPNSFYATRLLGPCSHQLRSLLLYHTVQYSAQLNVKIKNLPLISILILRLKLGIFIILPIDLPPRWLERKDNRCSKFEADTALRTYDNSTRCRPFIVLKRGKANFYGSYSPLFGVQHGQRVTGRGHEKSTYIDGIQ